MALPFEVEWMWMAMPSTGMLEAPMLAFGPPPAVAPALAVPLAPVVALALLVILAPVAHMVEVNGGFWRC